MLYMCSLPVDVVVKGDEPRRVLLRIYGQIIRESAETVLTDSVLFALLAEKGLGPKLYGVFTSGRVEEYVPVRAGPCVDRRSVCHVSVSLLCLGRFIK